MQHQDKQPNKLITETSPYLLQHAYNPVDWHAWNDATLAKAVNEDKLMIISIGYTACHWCHVMEHESFEDSVVAERMNTDYLSIKIDREERPDIDQIYMNAAHIITGRGGWPLNAIALPDGRPIFAGTYFPKQKWIQVLDYFTQLRASEPEKLEQQAQAIMQGLKQVDIVPIAENKASFTRSDLDTIWSNWEDRIDYKFGGRIGAPKFMMPNNYEFLLRYYTMTKNPKVLEAINITLQSMADGGLYDHVGGGFARYSVDEFWKVPHFEKMLYDNGQLVSLYAHAYQLTKNPYYKQVIEESLAFVEREMTDESNGFYSSIDADSEGEEGKFYVWQMDELQEVLGDDFEFIADVFSIKEKGNWEHGNNVLWITKPKEELLSRHQIDATTFDAKVNAAKAKLLKARSARIRPGLDDKILTSWNALMLNGYVDAYRALGNENYKTAALANAQFILKNCKRSDGGLNRNYKNGKSTINAFLNDYSLTIEAFINLYQITFDELWLEEAKSLAEYVLQHFYDKQSGLFFFTSDEDPALISRTKEMSDNVISASNSSMAKALFTLGMYYFKKDYIDKAKQMLNNMKESVLQNGPFYANWANLMTMFVEEPYEVAILGKDCQSMRQDFDQQFLPNVLFLGSTSEGKLDLLQNKYIKGQTTIYVCKQKACKLPVVEVEQALGLID